MSSNPPPADDTQEQSDAEDTGLFSHAIASSRGDVPEQGEGDGVAGEREGAAADGGPGGGSRPSTPSRPASALGGRLRTAPADRGIVTVVERAKRSELDEEGQLVLEQLAGIQRFEPLVKSSLSTEPAFGFAMLFGALRRAETPQAQAALSPEPFERIAQSFRTHLQSMSQQVCADQARLDDNMVKLEQFAVIVANTIAQRQSQMRSTVEQLSQVSNIKSQTRKTMQILEGVAKALSRLDPMLPPELRLDSPETAGMFPTLGRFVQHRKEQAEKAERQQLAAVQQKLEQQQLDELEPRDGDAAAEAQVGGVDAADADAEAGQSAPASGVGSLQSMRQ